METWASGRLSLISRSIVAASIAMFVSPAVFSRSALRHVGRQPALVRLFKLRDRYGTGTGECQFAAPHRADTPGGDVGGLRPGQQCIRVGSLDQVTRLVLAEHPGDARCGCGEGIEG